MIVTPDLIVSIVDEATNGSARSRQSNSRVLGVSDVGGCREYVRRMIVGEEPSQEVHRYDFAAFIGTAIGDHMEDAFIRHFPDHKWVKQDEVTVTLEVRGWIVNIPGHPDLYDQHNLIDFKTKNGLGAIRSSGPSQNEHYQRVLYTAALIKAGKMDDGALMHLVYIDRSGDETVPYIDTAQFEWRMVDEAIEWLGDAIYAVENDEEAMRDKPREWCFAACPFAPACRGEDDSDVEGVIEDPILLDAVKVYTEASERIRAAEKDKKSAASVLADVSGNTGEFKVRWVEISPTEVPAFTKRGYRRLDIRPVRKR